MTSTDRRNDTFISRIYRQAREYERLDINLRPKGFWRRNARYLIAIPLSGLICFLLPSGYPAEFLEMVATILSVLIGLLLTALVFALDKANPGEKDKSTDYDIEVSESDEHRDIRLTISKLQYPNAQEKIWKKQSQFYISKFNVMTGKNLITSLWALALIGICVLFQEQFGTNLNVYVWTAPDVESILLFACLTCVIIIRFLIMYFLIGIFYNTSSIIASLVNYMSVKILR